MPGEREYDLVLFGATGFTGGLTADYLAANAPAGLRWALVGRNRSKLEAVAVTAQKQTLRDFVRLLPVTTDVE